MSSTSPMISVPLKATSEIDWVQPLKRYIRDTYGDNPDKYSEECNTLNRLRQDMRGAGKESAAGRDLLYRYYGQLELLDLRFPVDENHIKISFTWFDAFTHKPTAQYSLAYEKASIIFNISAVLSCHAAFQSRSEEAGLKTAYHSFQASAGMFTYINENFLHAPSTDLSRETVKTLIQITLAQAQEVFLEKQIADGKKAGLLAKLASQAANLYTQATEGVVDNVTRGVFEKSWLLLSQIKTSWTNSLAQYYQALADDDANNHGVAIARLQIAETSAKDAVKLAGSFPSSPPTASNLGTETAANLSEMCKRQLSNVTEKLAELLKDNDFIYHQTIPPTASLAAVPKLPAAKAIPVSELYAGQDIQRITGPDIFQKIVPMAVTESASLYDEEKAKMVRAEAEKVDTADGELAAALDYLRLPGSLNVMKGSSNPENVVDSEFSHWCEDIAAAGSLQSTIDDIRSAKDGIFAALDKSSKQLDMEESVCEKMRSKYEHKWQQTPSSQLTTTLRNDIRTYRENLIQVSGQDDGFQSKIRLHEAEFDEMRSAGETGEADVLYQTALLKAGSRGRNTAGSDANLLDDDFGSNDGPSVKEQVTRVEGLLEKLRLIKRERQQVLKDLKEKVHEDDISQVLILNKKSISNFETQLFQAELEKFRPYQTRLQQANHKQQSLLNEVSASMNVLLQDKRVQAEKNKLEVSSRSRTTVMNKYRKAYQDFEEVRVGLNSAQQWYNNMKSTINSLEKNVESFVNNRRAEGGEMLQRIESSGRFSPANTQGQSTREDYNMPALMQRMSMGSSNSAMGHNMSPRPQSTQQGGYGNNHYQTSSGITSPPPSNYGMPQNGQYDPATYRNQMSSPPPSQQNYSQQQYNRPQQIPTGYVPPPPPPGPPPLGPQQTFPPQAGTNTYGSTSQYLPAGVVSPNGVAGTGKPGPVDPFAGLSQWR